MSLRIQKNIEKVFVAKDVATTASRDGLRIDELGSGEIAVFSPGGAVLNTTTGLTFDSFKIGYKSTNGEVIMSDLIPKASIKNYKGKLSVAPTEQIDYIGYNGTTGAIEVINSNLYLIRLHFGGTTEKTMMEQYIKYGVYESDTAATEEEIALGLVQNLWANMKRETEYRILCELVNSGTTSATSGGAWTVVNGSDTVTTVESAGAAGDAAKFNADGSTLVVGDYIRFGHATTTTYSVYKITAITGAGTAAASVTLDRPYQGASGSVAAANAGGMAAATAQAADFGLKLTGVAKDWVLGQKAYNKVSWTAHLTDFGTTTVTESVKAKKGSGTYWDVAEAEWFAQGFEGGMSFYKARAFAPAYTSRIDAESGHYYNILCFNFSHSSQSEIGHLVTSPKSIYIALNSGTAANSACTATSIKGGGTFTGLVEVLDAIVVDAKVGAAQTAAL